MQNERVLIIFQKMARLNLILLHGIVKFNQTLNKIIINIKLVHKKVIANYGNVLKKLTTITCQMRKFYN